MQPLVLTAERIDPRGFMLVNQHGKRPITNERHRGGRRGQIVWYRSIRGGE